MGGSDVPDLPHPASRSGGATTTAGRCSGGGADAGPPLGPVRRAVGRTAHRPHRGAGPPPVSRGRRTRRSSLGLGGRRRGRPMGRRAPGPGSGPPDRCGDAGHRAGGERFGVPGLRGGRDPGLRRPGGGHPPVAGDRPPGGAGVGSPVRGGGDLETGRPTGAVGSSAGRREPEGTGGGCAPGILGGPSAGQPGGAPERLGALRWAPGRGRGAERPEPPVHGRASSRCSARYTSPIPPEPRDSPSL